MKENPPYCSIAELISEQEKFVRERYFDIIGEDGSRFDAMEHCLEIKKQCLESLEHVLKVFSAQCYFASAPNQTYPRWTVEANGKACMALLRIRMSMQIGDLLENPDVELGCRTRWRLRRILSQMDRY